MFYSTLSFPNYFNSRKKIPSNSLPIGNEKRCLQGESNQSLWILTSKDSDIYEWNLVIVALYKQCMIGKKNRQGVASNYTKQKIKVEKPWIAGEKWEFQRIWASKNVK